MPLSSGDFLRLYFKELEREHIAYVLLHSFEGFPERIGTDVDYAVRTCDLPRLAGLARAVAERHGWRLGHVIEPHIYALYTVVIDPEEPRSFLQLDACGHYVESGCLLMKDTELLANRRRLGDFSVSAIEVEFAYLLAKGLGKGDLNAGRAGRLRELWEREPGKCEAAFSRLVGEGEGPLSKWFDRAPQDWETLRRIVRRRKQYGLGEKLREAVRALKRIGHPKGLHVMLAGGSADERGAVLARFGPLIEGPFFRRRRVLEFGTEAQPAASWEYARRYWTTILPAKVRNQLVLSSVGLGNANLRAGGQGPASKLRPQADLTFVLRPGCSAEEMGRELCREAIEFLARREAGN